MKVLLVDDEPLAVQRMEKMLAEIDGYLCVGSASNGAQAMQKIELLKPDIVLSDIRMPDMDGIELAKLLRQSPHLQTVLIFTTAYEEHALQAFDLQASGYLLKPVNKDKLLLALERASQWVLGQRKNSGRKHLSASSRGKIELISLDDVRLLQAEHKYVTVYHKHGEALIDDSLKMLEDEFPEQFKRVHRNALVSVEHIESLEKGDDGQYYVKLQDIAQTAQVSRRLLADVRHWLKQL